jgi:trk system potassium uptake protein TrkA
MIVTGAILNVAENDDELAKLVEEKNFDEAVVAMGEDFEATLMATHVLKEAGIPVSVKASSERRGNVLSKLGADRVVFPERDMGRRLAQIISTEAEIDVLELPRGFMVEKMDVGRGFHGRTVQNLDTSKRFGIWLLLLYQGDTAIQPMADTIMRKGDKMVVFGQKDNMQHFEKENFG